MILTVFTLNAFGGDKRDRTADLLNAIQALSQLSYTPMFLRALSSAQIFYQIWMRIATLFLQKKNFFSFRRRDTGCLSCYSVKKIEKIVRKHLKMKESCANMWAH